MPNLGMVEYLEEHLPQKICPQALQWCCKGQEASAVPRHTFTIRQHPQTPPALPYSGSSTHLPRHDAELHSAPVTLLSIDPVRSLPGLKETASRGEEGLKEGLHRGPEELPWLTTVL